MVQIPDSIEIPASVLEIVDRLEAEGHETWCVGGAIRDALLGDPHSDVDLATAALPAVVRRIFRRTVPIGIEHGTVGVLDSDGVLHEVTTFRRDVRTDGRHAEVEFGASLDDDLARRDFTINAIAWHPRRREWCDPFGGIDDIRAGLVRAVGVAEQRFREDRLRIIRAIRFATRLGFAIEPETWAAARRLASDTGELSAERVRDEWWKSVDRARDVREVI
ncbi:MAG TPA: polynucleotide adenylyltransferase, partial [Gemmatimonadales bacterium]|nr:polynucleotide adenylyltransferase [Gemmatimonadales bacterium]